MTDDVVYEEPGTELARIETPPSPTLFGTDNPLQVIEKATRMAGPLANLVAKQGLYTTISGRKHVRVEGWTLLGSMLGVFAVCTWTRELENGWEARVEARTRDGSLVGAAEAECLRSENTWKNRDDYALRSMAQTRATSKALRQPLGFVMQLAGFDPTPAEEIPQPSQRTAQTAAPKPTAAERKQLDTVIASLTVADPARDWADMAEKYCRREFSHGIAALTKDENAQTVAAMQTFLDTLTNTNGAERPEGAQA